MIHTEPYPVRREPNPKPVRPDPSTSSGLKAVEGLNGAPRYGHPPFDLLLSKDRMVRQAHHERFGGRRRDRNSFVLRTPNPFVLSRAPNPFVVSQTPNPKPVRPEPVEGTIGAQLYGHSPFDKLRANGLIGSFTLRQAQGERINMPFLVPPTFR
jgi:hypothetical protein